MMRIAGRVLPVALGLLVVGSSANAFADDPPEDGATLIRTTTEPSFVLRPWRGHEARLGRELTWARFMLASDAPTLASDEPHAAAPWLDLAAFRGDQALLRPHAGESAITAVGSMVTAGLPVLGVWRGGKLRQRHVLRGWFRNKGIALAWRIEF